VSSGRSDPEVVYRRRWLTLAVLCVSLIVISLDNTILNVALPTLGKATRMGGLDATESQLQWVVDGYTIVFAGFLLTAGSLGDRFGRRSSLAIGLAVFGIGSVLASQATSPNELIAFRCFMGLGGALIMPSTLSILDNVFTEPVERGRAIGIWAGVASIGVGVGPVTGGFLLAHFWWGSVLVVNVPIVIAGLIAGYFLVPDSKDPSAPRLDPIGAFLSIAALSTLLWAVIEAPSRGWGSAQVVIAFGIGAVVLIGFTTWELKYDSPMLNLQFFTDARFSAASAAITLNSFALFGTIFLLTQYLQTVLGYSPLKAGALLVPLGVVLLVASPLSARLNEQIGSKVLVGVGLLLVAAGLLLMVTLNVGSHPISIIAVLVLAGAGMGNVFAPATNSIMGSLPPAKAGVGSAMNDTTRQFGGAVGVAVLGSVLSSEYRQSFAAHVAGTHAPAAIVAIARDSIQHALGVTQHLPPTVAAPLANAARVSFVNGFHVAVITASAISTVAAIAVFRWLPARARPIPTVDAPTVHANIRTEPSEIGIPSVD
jgi:EmrB/QacA subfamily drug resistance transporter